MINSVYSITRRGYSVLTVNKNKYTALSVMNLMPDSSYNLYCYTRGLDGYEMSLATVLQTKQLFKTSCCRSIAFDKTNIPTKISATDIILNKAVYAIRISSVPRSPVIVAIAINSCYNSSNTVSYTHLTLPTIYSV